VKGPLYALACAAAFIGCGNKTNNAAPDAASSAAPVGTLVYDAGVVNDTTVPTALVQRALNPQNLPAYTGPTGSVEGIVRKNGPPSPKLGLSSATFVGCPDAEKMYGVAFREGEPDAAGRRALFDAIVIVKPAAEKLTYFVKENDEAETLNIVGCGYERRTVVMTFGQRLEVKNLTKEYWVPELDPKTGVAMMMAAPNGADPVKLYPKQPGRYHLVDHDRKYVVDDLMVVQQPLHAVTDENGHFRIDGIPVGAMKIAASHPEIPDVVATSDFEIKEGVVTNVDLTMNYVAPVPKDGGADGWKPVPGLH
jgi:hypothetical protein